MYKGKFGHSVDEEVIEKDGIQFSVTRGEINKGKHLSRIVGRGIGQDDPHASELGIGKQDKHAR